MEPAGTPVFTNDRYTSPEFAARERSRIFRATWLVAARASEIANAGDRLAVDELDESLLLVRGNDQRVRAFHNACRHRGTRLVEGRCSASSIVCPYHAWTYALDGRLVGVPKAKGFDTLDREAKNLIEVRCDTWGGFVWITFDRDAPPLAEYLGGLVAQLDPYRLEEMRPLLRRSWTLPCNWKAVLDQATESYHLRAVHPRLERVVNSSLTLHELDPHSLQTIPIPAHRWRDRMDALTAPRDLALTPEQTGLFHKFWVFPNTILNVMPSSLTVFRVVPLTPDSCRFHYEFHLRRGAGLLGRLRAWLTLAGSLYILREDFHLLPRFQAGVRSAATGAISFHAEESALAFFHRVVDRHLGER